MPLDITGAQLEAIWNDQSELREDMTKRQDYYDGKHAIIGRGESYADGAEKKERVANWIAYMVNRYVGLITSTPYQVTNKEDDSDSEGPAAYSDIVADNRVRGQDVSHLRTALIHGHSIELHEFNQEIVISQHDPRNWALIHDSDGAMVGAIYRVDLPANTIIDGVLVTDEQHLMWFYDDARIRSFGMNDADKWIEGDETKHEFGRVPVVVWKLNDTESSFITDAMIGLNDEYNEIFSAGGDDVRRDVDAILAVSGFGSAELLEAMPMIRAEKFLPMPEDGSTAEYITRKADVEPGTRHLQRTREVLHMSGEVPDVEDITGTTGSASGIALKLKFLPMLQAASAMANNIEAGIRDRIELINAVMSKRSGSKIIEDYNVVIQFTLPTNSIEEWANIGNLTGIVSHKTMLELLSDIDDPEAELKRIEAEGVPEDDEGLTPEATAAKQDEEIDKLAEESAPAVEAMITAITLAVTEQIIQSGAIDKMAAKAKAGGGE